MSVKQFVNGLIVKRNDKAPDFVLCSLSMKVDELIQFLQANNNGGWVNVDCKRGKSGKLYAEVNSWKPSNGGQSGQANFQQSEQLSETDIPF